MGVVERINYFSHKLRVANFGSRTISPRKIALPPGDVPSGQVPPGWLPPKIIASEENYPPDNCCPPGWSLPDHCSQKITPKIIAPWQYSSWILPPRKIAFRKIAPRTNGPEKTAPRKIVPRINYTRDVFSPRIRNPSNLIDSCFLLFSFFVV